MCGIVGYIGRNSALGNILDGLEKVEYRGYDSAGIAVLNKGLIHYNKKVKDGRTSSIELLRKDTEGNAFFKSNIGIGHTRWATHGRANEVNAHPQFDCYRHIAVVHNGMIENYKELNAYLSQGHHTLLSATDTELIAHLIEEFKENGQNNKSAFLSALKVIKGTYALVVMFEDDPDTLYSARLGSPLVIGVGNGENFLASDPSALVEKTKNVIYLNDGEVAEITKDNITITDLDDQSTDFEIVELEMSLEQAQKGDYQHFMRKEIDEGPKVIKDTFRGRLKTDEGLIKLGGLEQIKEQLMKTERIIIVGCGTSYNAGLIGEHFFEEIAGIPTEVEYASEFRYKNQPFGKNTIVIAISQSGETKDTLIALEKAKEHGLLTLGIVNVVGSSIARLTDAGVYNHAGPEIGVASTKAFLSQITVLFLMAAYFAKNKPISLMKELEIIPQKIEDILIRSEEIEHLANMMAEKYKNGKGISVIGHNYDYPIALEGALKLTEVTCLNAKGSPAAEIKHWSIALVDENYPTIAIVPKNGAAKQVYSNLEQIKSRSGPIVAIATKGDTEISALAEYVFYVPKTLEPFEPLLTIVPLQLLAYYMAVCLGHDPDRPRNLAKSVTVQ